MIIILPVVFVIRCRNVHGVAIALQSHKHAALVTISKLMVKQINVVGIVILIHLDGRIHQAELADKTRVTKTVALVPQHILINVSNVVMVPPQTV